MLRDIWFFYLFSFLGLVVYGSLETVELRCSGRRAVKIGVIADNTSRVGREQIVAIQMASKHHQCLHFQLLLRHSPDNSVQATAAALDLITNEQVKALFGTWRREELSSILELQKPTKNIPVISLSSASIVPQRTKPIQTPPILQMANDITHQLQCIAAIIGKFQWQRVTALYEDKNDDFTTNLAVLEILSDSLRNVNSEIENHMPFSLSDPNQLTEKKLMKLCSNSNRVFILVQSSMELATIIFKKAKELNMMGKGYVWIVADEIANLVDSLDSSVFHSLQGVIGCKIYVDETKNSVKKFKTKLRRNYVFEFPEEEGQADPSVFAFRGYDAFRAVAMNMEQLQRVNESKFEGVSGVVRFENGILSNLPTFQIINVFGKGYKEIAFWSPKFGFSDVLHQQTSAENATINLSNLVILPGNEKTVPRGLDFRYREKREWKIGVPTTAAFKEFVQVNDNHPNEPPYITGFSISVFQKVAAHLRLPYIFIPRNKSYDALLKEVYDKELDGAVGDFGIFADRFKYVDFTEPYLDNAVVMIVKEKPLTWTRSWLFMRAFSTKMWLLMLSMHVFVSSVIWLVERKHNDELEGIGNMLWFSVSVLFYLHREPVKSGLARLVLGPWLFTILIVTASFTASLSSMMTISRSQPSFLDIETLKLRNATVGCNKGSVMKRALSEVMSFHPHNVKEIASVDLFATALETGEIQAAFMSDPHAKVFLAKHCKGFTKVTIFKLVGMAYAFPKGSPLTVDISESIAKLRELRELPDLKATLLSNFNCSSNGDDTNESGLEPEPFAGLLLISGVMALMAVLITTCRLAFVKLGWITVPPSSKPHIPV